MTDTPNIDPGTVIVTESGDGNFTQNLFDGRHRLLADEPASAGGDDRGPSPYELLLMALGACTSMTIRLYARSRKWPLERITIRLKHSRNYPEDCKECATKPVMLDHIDREIELTGGLSAEQTAKLREIADKCPVHRTLSQPVSISTTLKASNQT